MKSTMDINLVHWKTRVSATAVSIINIFITRIGHVISKTLVQMVCEAMS